VILSPYTSSTGHDGRVIPERTPQLTDKQLERAARKAAGAALKSSDSLLDIEVGNLKRRRPLQAGGGVRQCVSDAPRGRGSARRRLFRQGHCRPEGWQPLGCGAERSRGGDCRCAQPPCGAGRGGRALRPACTSRRRQRARAHPWVYYSRRGPFHFVHYNPESIHEEMNRCPTT
jgi:hypothetical protein